MNRAPPLKVSAADNMLYSEKFAGGMGRSVERKEVSFSRNIVKYKHIP